MRSIGRWIQALFSGVIKITTAFRSPSLGMSVTLPTFHREPRKMADPVARLKLLRTIFTDKSTIGELFFNDKFECFILEDTCRKEKKDHITAIPPGTYEIRMTHSTRFNRIMPELLNVVGYTGIRIHPGNVPDDTSGCLLTGRRHGTDTVSESISAYEALFPKIELALKEGPLYIGVIGGTHHTGGDNAKLA